MTEYSHYSEIKSPNEVKRLVIYTDASVRFGKQWRLSETDENPPGWAFATNSGQYGLGVKVWKKDQPKAISLSTWMEVIAITEAVNKIVPTSYFTVYTDSRFAISVIRSWQKTGRLTVPPKQQIDGRQLAYLNAAAQQFKDYRWMTMKWTPGHRGQPMNELVDGLARLASRSLINDLSMDDVESRANGLAEGFFAAMKGDK